MFCVGNLCCITLFVRGSNNYKSAFPISGLPLPYILVVTIVQTDSKVFVNNTSKTRYYRRFQRIKDPLVFRKELASPKNVSASRTYYESASVCS